MKSIWNRLLIKPHVGCQASSGTVSDPTHAKNETVGGNSPSFPARPHHAHPHAELTYLSTTYKQGKLEHATVFSLEPGLNRYSALLTDDKLFEEILPRPGETPIPSIRTGGLIYISDFNTAGDADVKKDVKLWGKSLI
jgi:hypothetical protein